MVERVKADICITVKGDVMGKVQFRVVWGYDWVGVCVYVQLSVYVRVELVLGYIPVNLHQYTSNAPCNARDYFAMRIDENVSATNGNGIPCQRFALFVMPTPDFKEDSLSRLAGEQNVWHRRRMHNAPHSHHTLTLTQSLTDTHTLAHTQNHAIEEIQLYWVMVWNIECGVVG